MITNQSQIPKRILSASDCQELVTLAQKFPVSGWDFPDWTHSSLDLNEIDKSSNLKACLEKIKQDLQANGYAVISILRLLESEAENISASCATLLINGLSSPLRVFMKVPHWRRIGVDLARPPQRSGGAGISPLHMDFVNSENPPDLVCLLCLRPDPLGGGASLVGHLTGIERSLETEEINELSLLQFTDGEVKNLNGIGRDVNPFPVLALQTRWKYRFTANLLSNPPNEKAGLALEVFSQILHNNTVSIVLVRGDLLILDQHQVTHGKQATGEGQGKIPDAQRRLLLHSFARFNS